MIHSPNLLDFGPGLKSEIFTDKYKILGNRNSDKKINL